MGYADEYTEIEWNRPHGNCPESNREIDRYVSGDLLLFRSVVRTLLTHNRTSFSQPLSKRTVLPSEIVGSIEKLNAIAQWRLSNRQADKF